MDPPSQLIGAVRSANIAPATVLIPAAKFIMGNDRGREDERPAHRVSLPAFRAAVAPVTNAQYGRFVDGTHATPPPFADDARFNQPEQPVVGVSWFEAVAYCEWLTSLVGAPYRLPTEAERELAAGGGTADDWPWPGGRAEGHLLYEALAKLDRPHVPSPACTNSSGLWCMGDNVHEWCSDWYDKNYYSASPPDAPTGPASGRRRASRGGSWRHAIKFSRITARSSIDPSFRYNDYGFRVYADA